MIDFSGLSSAVGTLTAPLRARAQEGAKAVPDAPSGGGTAEAEFLKYARMSPAERMRDAVLKQLGVTEEDLKAMSPEKRQAIEKKMAEMIKEQVEADPSKKGKTGQIADIMA